MPKICYKTKNFRAEALGIIYQAQGICDEYAADGYVLTLRQLYYQFVARDLLPNRQQSYTKLSAIVSDARLAGLIDWNHLEDRTRNLEGNSHWSSPERLVEIVAEQFRQELWKDQPNRVEVWVEKEALAAVVERAATELDVDYFSCRGYVSQSEMWNAAMRIQRYERAGQEVTILHLGDHDPSGIDMTRDIQDRLLMFGTDVTVNRIALNMDQVEEYNPPPNPAKLSDARSDKYIELYGEESWELDALNPATLEALITEHVTELRDVDLWEESFTAQESAREALTVASAEWSELVIYMQNRGWFDES